MNELSVPKSFQNYCPTCIYFQTETGVCIKFHQNVREYPKKFEKRCNGKYYEFDSDKKDDYIELLNNMKDEELIDIIENRSSEYPMEVLTITTSIVDKYGGIKQLKENIEKAQKEETPSLKKDEKIQSRGESVVGAKEVSTASYEFKTLLGYGKLVSGLGWVVVLLGLFGIIAGLGSGHNGGFLLAGGAFIACLIGLGMVAAGQLISCFVSIEKNTRTTYEILNRKH